MTLIHTLCHPKKFIQNASHLTIKYKTLKHLVKNIVENFCDLGLGKNSLDTTTKAWSTKAEKQEVMNKILRISTFQETLLME